MEITWRLNIGCKFNVLRTFLQAVMNLPTSSDDVREGSNRRLPVGMIVKHSGLRSPGRGADKSHLDWAKVDTIQVIAWWQNDGEI